jgi:DNA-binding NtrC family response regulator
MNVVLVENDVALLRTLEMLLESLGNQVRAFHDPTEACSFLERCDDLDFLIIDYMMPELTAPEILQRLKGHLPNDSKVILISGHTDVVKTLNLEGMGVYAFLNKPLDLDRLFEILHSDEMDPFRRLHIESPRAET